MSVLALHVCVFGLCTCVSESEDQNPMLSISLHRSLAFLLVCFCSETGTFTELKVRRRWLHRVVNELHVCLSCGWNCACVILVGPGVPNLGPQSDVLGT